MNRKVTYFLVLSLLLAWAGCGPDATLEQGRWTGTMAPMNHPDAPTPIEFDIARNSDGLTITLIGPDNSEIPILNPIVKNDTLRYSFHEPEQGVLLSCNLEGTEAGIYEGRCSDTNNKWALFTMIPPVAVSERRSPAADSVAILRTLDSWNEGWQTSNAQLAVQSYAEDADWTNAFGDRVLGRDSLEATLTFIFGLDFVMAGDSGENEYSDLTFLAPDIALLRSKLVRVGQQIQSGETMPDRHIHHLRVYERRNGEWKIVSHLISQALPKR